MRGERREETARKREERERALERIQNWAHFLLPFSFSTSFMMSLAFALLLIYFA
jgi:hypothetical protein